MLSIFLQAKLVSAPEGLLLRYQQHSFDAKASCGKMMGFRQNAEALEKSKHLRVLILKFKAEAQQQCLLCKICPNHKHQTASVSRSNIPTVFFVGKCMERHEPHKRTKDAFVDSNTTYAEVGGVKVVNANGTCLSCDSQAVACCRIQ